MDAVSERDISSPPAVYEDWLHCFDLLGRGCTVNRATMEYIARGTFSGSGYIASQLEQKLVDTVNIMLGNRISRFLKDLNMMISLGELADIAPLFARLKSAAADCMFFTGLVFLREEFTRELEHAIHIQMREFWNDTVAFLRVQALESGSRELEDSLYIIGRISIFADKVLPAKEGMVM